MTIPWGTSRHRDLFFLIWELSTLSCSVPSAPLSGEPSPGTSSLLGTPGCRARWHQEPPPPAPQRELQCGETLQWRAEPQKGETDNLHKEQKKFSNTEYNDTLDYESSAEPVTAA